MPLIMKKQVADAEFIEAKEDRLSALSESHGSGGGSGGAGGRKRMLCGSYKHILRPTSRLLFRLLSLMFCVAVVFLIVTNKQTTTIQFPGFFPFTKTATFKSSYSFVYLVVATASGAIYAFLHVVDFIVVDRGADGRHVCSLSMAWLVLIMDQALTYAILGAAAASTELAYLATHGLEDAGWIEVCSYLGRFCNQMGVAIAISYLGTVSFAMSSVLSALGLFRRYWQPATLQL